MFSSFEPFRRVGIANLIAPKVDHSENGTVLDFAFPQLMQVRLPLPILAQIFCCTLRQKNVAGVTAVHDPLRYVDSSSCDVRALIYIRNFADRSAMKAHPHAK